MLPLFATGVTGCGDEADDDADVAEEEGEDRGEVVADIADDELDDQTDVVTMGMAAEILLTIDEGEIQNAKTALGRVSDPNVISFANRMIAEHTDHAIDVLALAELLDLTFVGTQTSAEVRLDYEAQDRDLASISSGGDYVYTRGEVVLHSEALEVVDELDGNIVDFTFLDFLDATEEMLEFHRDEASAILRQL
jgi:putative membrane protein